MTDYANFLEQMQQSYEQLAGMRADDASDVGIRFKILAEQLSKIKERSWSLQNNSLFHRQQQVKIWKCTRWNVEFFASRQPMQKERFDFPGSQLHRTDILIPQGVFLTCSQTEGKSWNRIFVLLRPVK